MKQTFELVSVSLRKDLITVLDNINLVLESGPTYAIMGPNGSGKSSLLRLLNLLEPASKGDVLYSGIDTRKTDLVSLRREMALVSQNPVMFNCSVFKNVAFGLKFRNVSRAEIKKRVHDMLGTLSLDVYASRNARTLSGGERQKVAIARALVLSPKILMLDEPTANLDLKNEAEIERLIGELKRTRETTIIMVTHEASQARRMADKIIFMRNGRIASQGNTELFCKNSIPELFV